ncbi:MAG: hypothetical protein LBI04_02450 [Treponema sp.]|jgi:hypothetical protein|nr:hypothetical protein [Treponema sp.]
MRKFLTVCVFFILAVLCLTTCDNPTALGSQVPLPTPSPVINIIVTEDYGKGPGAFISGTETIYVEATVKQGIKSVTATYTYFTYDEEGKLIEHKIEKQNVPFDPQTGYYTLDIDTLNPLGDSVPMADGTLKVIVEAEDTVGNKTVTPELIYTVKNNPPFISLQIPKARPSLDKVTQYNQHELDNSIPPLVVTNNYIMGVFEDLAGVKNGYPQIKLWKEGYGEPSDYKANAGWAGVTSSELNAGGGWLYLDDEGSLRSETGDKGGSFRYYLRNRKSDGTPEGEEAGRGLEPGTYYLKMKAQDINGIPVEWPKDAYKNTPEYLKVELTADTTPPIVTILYPTINEIYQRDNFNIKANAEIQGDLDTHIALMEFTVTGKDRKTVLLERLFGSEIEKEKSGIFNVHVGKTYYCEKDGDVAVMVDNVEAVPPGAFSQVTFENGNLNFTVIARGDSNSRGTASISIYIDTLPPVTSVTSVNPFYTLDRIGDTAAEDSPNNETHDYGTADAYRRWTVNKTVQLSVSSFDAQGNAIDDDTGYTQLKYFFLKNEDVNEAYYTVWKAQEGNSGKSFGEYLFAREDAEYFDKVIDNPVPVVPSEANPLIKVVYQDGAYTLTLQTHKYDSADKYKLWFYIAAMDKAGNAGYAKILLSVDQETDKPEIDSNIKGAFMGEKFAIEISVKDDNKLLANSASYRFAKNEADKNSPEGQNWHQLTADSQQLSADNLSINIKDFKLQKIACNLLGCNHTTSTTMDDDHKKALGLESEKKFIQIKAVDDVSNKIYATDGVEEKISDWIDFTVDLTPPKIVPSETDENGSSITRDDTNPFIAPQKDNVYTGSFDFTRGDLKEANLNSITVKFDGNQKFEITDPTIDNSEPAGDGFAIWKTKNTGWDGELRWRIPVKTYFDALEEGSHTFEITFEDKISQITSKSMIFYKDTSSPVISLINPKEMDYLTDAEFTAIKENKINTIPGLEDKYDKISDGKFSDSGAKLIGNFTNAYSTMFNAGENKFWYKIDDAATWTEGTVTTGSAVKTASWQIDLADMEDGIHRFSIRVTDASGNGCSNIKDPPAGTDGGPGYQTNLAFMLDRGIPILSITSPDPWPDFVNEELTIEGTIKGTYSVTGLNLKLNNGEIELNKEDCNLVSDGEKSFNYKITIPAAGLTEKSYSMKLTATGGAGSDIQTGNFTFDKTPPAVSFSTPNAGTEKENGKLPSTANDVYGIYWSDIWVTGYQPISGNSDDKNGITKIYYHLGKLNNSPSDGTTDANRETAYNTAAWNDTGLDDTSPLAAGWSGSLNSWNFKEDLNQYWNDDNKIEKDVQTIINSEGKNKFYLPLYLKIIDRADNIRIVQYKIFVDPDLDIPRIDLTSPAERVLLTEEEVDDINTALNDNTLSSDTSGLKDKYDTLVSAIITDTNAKLSGSFTDEYSAIFNASNDRYWYKIDDGAWQMRTITPAFHGRNTVNWQIDLTDNPDDPAYLADGIHRLSIRVQDIYGNGYTDTNDESNPNDNIVKFGIPGHGYETNLAFMIARAAPKLTVAGVDPLTNKDIDITGIITEALFVKGLSISLDDIVIADMDEANPAKKITVERQSDGSYKYAFTVSVAGKDDGPYSIMTTVTGASDRSASVVKNYTLDTTNPAVSITNPVQKSYLNDADFKDIYTDMMTGAIKPGLQEKYKILIGNTIKDTDDKLRGTFTDVYSRIYADTNSYYYKIDTIGSDGTTIEDVIPWTKAAATPNESKNVPWEIGLLKLDNTILEDGIYRLSLRVKDELGNGYDNNSTDAILSNIGNGPGYETNMAFIIASKTPVLTLTNAGTFINGSSTIEGTIEDALFIQRLSISLDGALKGDTGTNISSLVGSISLTEEPDGSYKFTMLLPGGLDEISHSVQINITGASDQSDMKIWNFTYDKSAPSVQFNAPSVGTRKQFGDLSNNGKYSIWWSGAWVTGQVRIGGTSDDTYGVDKIYYHIGSLGEDNLSVQDKEAIYDNPLIWTDTLLDTVNPAQYWSGGLYYWNYSENLNPYQFSPSLIEEDVDLTTSGLNAFYLPFYVKVVDKAGNINIVHYKIYVDPDMDIPQAFIVTPEDKVRVGGEVRISGTANDNNWVQSVDIRIRDVSTGSYYKNVGDDWVETPDLGIDKWSNPDKAGWVKAKIMGNTDMMVNWYYSVNGDGKLNPDPGKLDRHVEVEVRAWDTKDNNHIIPDLVSGPSTTFNYYFDSGVPTISVPLIEKTGNPNRDYVDGIRVSGEFKISAEVQDDGGLSSIRARITGKSAFVEIVKDGMDNIGTSEPGWEITTPAIASTWESGWRYYIVNPGTINNWQDIDLAYTPGKTYGNGVMIQYNGNTITGGGATVMKADGTRANDFITKDPNNPIGVDDNPYSANWNSQVFKYTVAFTIDSTTITNLGYGKTGFFTLELDVYDNNQVPAPYNTKGTYNLGVDNYYPTTEITTQYNATTENFYVMGTAQDYDTQSGSILGLERVLVYFERGGVYYNPRGKTTGDVDEFYQSGKGNIHSSEWGTLTGIPAMTSWPNVRDMSPVAAPGYGPNVTNFGNFPLLKLREKGNTGDVWESPHAMVIDGQELGADVDTDVDGTFAEMWDGRVDKIWQARLDTTLFPDGPITVHYIVMDQAGNATHYTNEIFIGNNRPLIREINLGTDINGNGNITPWTSNSNPGEYLVNPITIGKTDEGNAEYTTNFRIRNNSFGLTLNALYGNGTKHYRVFYVTRDSSPVLSTAMNRGEVYTINDPGTTDWTKYGAFNNNMGTTFVASGPARQTTGSVWKYTVGGANTEENGAFTNGTTFDSDNNRIDVATGIIFNSFTNMPDTAGKAYDADGNMILMHDKLFIIKVYDETVQAGVGVTEFNQLAHVALINVDFDNTDTNPPLVSVADFGKKFVLRNSAGAGDSPTMANNADQVIGDVSDYNDNIVIQTSATAIENGKRKGYVQYKEHNDGGTGNPHISGTIIINGKASDNRQIHHITAQIDNYNGGNPFTIASWDTATMTIKPAQTIDAMKPDISAIEWGFNVTDEKMTMEYGHVINWQFAWDSSTITNSVGSNINVVFRVYDTDVRSTPASALTVNIVPYITEIKTALSGAVRLTPSAFGRSALGYYPVRYGETGIDVKGFNLKAGAATPTVRVNSEETATTYNLTVTASTKNMITVTATNTGNTLRSGPLAVVVNGVDSFNNRNNNDAAWNSTDPLKKSYNMEPNGVNNNILNDDRKLYVWDTGVLASSTVQFQNPFMRMDSAGHWYLSYGKGANQMAVRKDGAETVINQGYNKFINTTVAYNTSNDPNNWYVAGSSASRNGDVWNTGASSFSFYNRRLGQGITLANTTYNATSPNSRRDLESANGGNGVYEVERVKLPRVAVTGTNAAAKIYMAYYDGNSANNPLVFRYGESNDYNNFQYDIRNGLAAASTVSAQYRQTVASSTTTYQSSLHTAVGGLSSGRAVIAWYAPNEQSLIFSFSSNTNPASTAAAGTNTNNWQNNAIIIEDGFVGWYVDMAVDEDNGVHLAYYATGSGGLHYAYLSNAYLTGLFAAANKTAYRDANPPPVMRVDTYLSAGTNLQISTRKENGIVVPYISYNHGSFAQTTSAIRVAWRKDFSAAVNHGTDDLDQFTGDWEVVSVPAQNVPMNQFAFNGVPTGTGTFGTAGAGGINTNPISGVDLRNTVLVGYLTDENVERSYLRGKISR